MRAGHQGSGKMRLVRRILREKESNKKRREIYRRSVRRGGNRKDIISIERDERK